MKISSFFKPLSFLPALALMYMIYSFSSQPADSSTSTSFYVSRRMVQAADMIAQKGWDDWQIETYAGQINGIVRKGAHMTEYFLLAVAVSFPLYVYGVRGILLMLLSGIICVGYAFGDEYHQSLVSGRASSLRDVGIDSIGVFFGVILTRLLGWSGRMAITGPAYERRQKKQQMELDAREEELRRREESLRREEQFYRRQRYAPRRPGRSTASAPNAGQSRPVSNAGQGRPVSNAGQGRPVSNAGQGRPVSNAVRFGQVQQGMPDAEDRTGKTRVIGTRHEVDDRTRVYRSEEERRRMEEAYRARVYERRRVQSQDLQDDNTSDQLAEDLPFSGLFRKKERE